MTLDPDEMAAQLEVTEAFIAADPTTITLIPRVRQVSATGAKFVDQPPRPPQVFKIIPMGGLVSGTARPTLTIDGVERVVEFTLMGMPTVVIARYDYWVMNGVRYEVLEVQPFDQYEIKASVERRG